MTPCPTSSVVPSSPPTTVRLSAYPLAQFCIPHPVIRPLIISTNASVRSVSRHVRATAGSLVQHDCGTDAVHRRVQDESRPALEARMGERGGTRVHPRLVATTLSQPLVVESYVSLLPERVHC